MDKSTIAALVDSLFAVLIFVVGKYVSADWVEVVKNIFLALQPIVVVLILRWLGIETAARIMAAMK
jgi:hypothetical protein